MDRHQYPYACTSSAHDGNARCRILEPCSVHGENPAPAPAPDVVLIKLNLNDKSFRFFRGMGVPLEVRSRERREALGREHAERATALGRSSQIRGERGDSTLPESHDSGTRVFGPAGAKMVRLANLLDELTIEVGYACTRASILVRENRSPARLQMEFTRGSRPNHPLDWDGVLAFMSACFGQVDVWANDRDQRGKVVHTVNCGKRDESAKPQWTLRFAWGEWELHGVVEASDADATSID